MASRILDTAARFRSIPQLLLLCISALSLVSCATVEDKRIRQLLNDKGFGTRAEGVPRIENHIVGGDSVMFVIDPQTYLNPGAEQLYLLTSPQTLSIDGTILVPYVGPIDVLGMTERELSALVKESLGALFTFPIELHARIIDVGKAVYIYGEIEGPHYVRLTKPDVTLLELLSRTNITNLANWGRIHLVRPDAENPLTMVINVREMWVTGHTAYNIPLQNNDIIYVPPTFLGHIARLVEKLLEPLNVAVQSLFGVAAIQSSYDVLTGDAVGVFPGGGFRF